MNTLCQHLFHPGFVALIFFTITPFTIIWKYAFETFILQTGFQLFVMFLRLVLGCPLCVLEEWPPRSGGKKLAAPVVYNDAEAKC